MSQLDFILNLVNRVTEPLDRIKNAVSGVAEESQKAFGKISAGGKTIADSFWSTHSFLEPAIQMDDALQSASLQGIDSSVMAKIAKDSVTFSSQYGKSAIEFVKSATEINKAVQGLEQTELPQMTKIANTTAVALKTSSTDAANYMGKMFDLFSDHAESVGHLQFAEELSGKAVFMAQTFGTSMPEMTLLLENTRKAGTDFGVGIDEQLAVLGQLQSTLGGDASHAYEAFLSVATGGAKSLGLSFVNASGQMLSMPEMLQKLQAKYGTSIEGNLKAQAEIEAAFGDSAVVVKALFNDVDALNKNMAALGANDGMERTREMAAQMADPWERLQAIWENLHILIGSALLPVIKPLVNWLADTSQVLVRWMKLFPNIARWVGYITLAIMNFAVVGAVANIVMGISKFVWMGLIAVWNTGAFILSLLTGKFRVLATVSTVLSTALTWLRSTLIFTNVAAWMAAAGLTAVTWPVLAIIAVIAGLVIVVIKFWQPIKAFIQGFIQGFGEASGALFPIASLFGAIGSVISIVWQCVKVLFGWFADLLAPIQYTSEELQGATDAGRSFGHSVAGAIEVIMTPINLIIQLIIVLVSLFEFAGEKISNFFEDFSLGNMFSGLGDILSFIPGFEIGSIGAKVIGEMVNDPMEKTTASNMGVGKNTQKLITQSNNMLQGQSQTISQQIMPQTVQSVNPLESEGVLTGGKKLGINRNGLMSEVANNSQTINDNSRRIESVTFNVSNGMTPDQFTEWEQVAYG
ncbi:phage tail tape measure protein [Xenorhabdus budapestensis]|uniref:Phage tail tape measure protein n=1 Tax=Xenorhabdus budapestensis TaxID=290110 RepID=A0A2D0IZW5_XENBU|nr:phage tail tape measure protein [Xenorhabdus budapestensis]PHM27481.1 phage tail tape measure protein [Xenorhabdus budapestensis]